jgi:hypothetical protein
MGLLYYPEIKKVRSQIKFRAFGPRPLLSKACILIAGFLLFLAYTGFAQMPLLDKAITIPKQNTTIYNALNLISQKADCLFIYDSKTIESDKHVKLQAENQPLKKVLDNLLANPSLSYKIIGKHILIYKAIEESKETILPDIQAIIPVNDTAKNKLIKGYVFDNETKTILPFATIGIEEENIGTVTNTDGYFTLKIPASLSGTSLVVSHMGYMSQRIPVQLLHEQQVDFYMDRRIISIQEVIIRYIDPNAIVAKALEQRKVNNAVEPVYLTTFYREGVQKNQKYISYSEAVFKVFKSDYTLSEHSDQVKMLKSRKIQDDNPRDTVFLKLKAGVLSALQLDIVKCVPGFLDLTPPSEYNYTYSDMVSYNAKDAYVITFVQKEDLRKALYAGTIYIEKESFAILGADFEINKDYLDIAADELVLKKSRRLIVKLEKINYSVSYMPFNGRYYLQHARCDIHLKTRLRNRLTSDNFHTFLELATCSIDTNNVERFPRQEVMKPNVVFSDQPYSMPDDFWGEFNVIVPEEKLTEALLKIIGKIEEIK